MAEIDTLNGMIETQQGELSEAANTVKDLKEKLAAKTAEKSAKNPVVTVDGEKYEVTIPAFNFEGKEYSADDVKTDAELAKNLVAIGFGGMMRVDRKKTA
jgi:Ni,Fe-hydrogenase I small subunit